MCQQVHVLHVQLHTIQHHQAQRHLLQHPHQALPAQPPTPPDTQVQQALSLQVLVCHVQHHTIQLQVVQLLLALCLWGPACHVQLHTTQLQAIQLQQLQFRQGLVCHAPHLISLLHHLPAQAQVQQHRVLSKC